MKVIITSILLILTLFSCDKKVRTDKRPNIIVIFTDDQGYADLGVQGINNEVKTPNIDALSNGGVRFTSGYVTAPQCSPSRAGIMTGRYQQRFGFDNNDSGPIPSDELIFPKRLQDIGYVTGMVGKWHLDPNHTSKEWLTENYPPTLKDHTVAIPIELCANYTPSSKGFNYYFWGNMNAYNANFNLDGDVYSQPKTIVDKRYRIDVQTEAALAFINNNQYDPFFLYLSYFGPHVPLQSEKKYISRFTDEDMDERRKVGLSMISSIDDGVGKVLDKLKSLNLENNTIIFFISDNGAPLRLSKPDDPITGIAGPWWDGSVNDPFVGEKGMLTEGGIRVPFIVYWKDSIEAGQVIDWPAISLDVATTAMALSKNVESNDLDGINLLDYIKKSNTDAPKRNLYWRFWNQAAIRQGNWKYLTLSDGTEYLFDLTNNSGELKNLNLENPEKSKLMRAELIKWTNELKYPGISTNGQINIQEKGWYDYHLNKNAKDSSTF
jgi:arylsulfatase A-like enzyme